MNNILYTKQRYTVQTKTQINVIYHITTHTYTQMIYLYKFY